ncbi:type I-E CRISPR-associated protein Cse1/CasA [Corynebacterium mendelii]|uniref:Type I-E CRISPR-associated protein Cse1/CasA n=1 Tax=Corynebacterium mendelii TaxID=2765362 RepID=A0A939IY40_9CORY|nr:type I-E CRISPR-associated protein Cse1/CasA [Corynebacterium mendelii]MBN9644272.1 type I-E CRISPR-associated protein Cse1/CasA [Corynebacterium mendelii]
MADNPHPSFNLIDKPWIPVLDESSRVQEINLRQAVCNAHRYTCLAAETPTVDFCILRLLIAVLGRSLSDWLTDDPASDWKELWDAETLPAEEINAYLDKWHDSFDLRDPANPFMQTAGLTNNNDTWFHFNRFMYGCKKTGSLFSVQPPEYPLTMAEAARWGLHVHAFDYAGIKTAMVGDPREKGGKIYAKDGGGIGWGGWLGALTVKGSNLKATVLHNFLPGTITPEDIPFWELGPLPVGQRSGRNGVVPGPLSLGVWPSRRFLFRFSDDDVVDAVRITYGDPVDHLNCKGLENQTQWRFSNPKSEETGHAVYLPQKLVLGRSLWRGISSFLPGSNGPMIEFHDQEVPRSILAENLDWFHRVKQNGYIEDDYLVDVEVASYEYGTQNGCFDTLITDKLTFKSVLANKDRKRLRGSVTTAVNRAEQAATAYKRYVRNLGVATGCDSKQLQSLESRAEQEMYSELDQIFADWLLSINGDSEPDAVLEEWTETLRELVLRLVDDRSRNVSDRAWVGREYSDGSQSKFMNSGLAEKFLLASLRKILPRKTANETEEKAEN